MADGQWCLSTDSRELNSNTPLLTAAVPSLTLAVTAGQATVHPWMATPDVKDMVFMVSLRREDKPQLGFTWEGMKYTFNQLPQGYKYSPIIAHSALAKLLSPVEVSADVHIYECIDDILMDGDNKEQEGQGAAAIWNLLNKNGLNIPPSNCQGSRQEVKFLGVWWIAGAVAVPHDTLSSIKKDKPWAIKQNNNSC